MASTSGLSDSPPTARAPAITYIYLAKGFFEALARAERTISDLVDGMDTHSSKLGFSLRLANMADIVEEMWAKVHRDYTRSHTGSLWDYEVTEPFGKLLANHLALHHTLPDNDEARAMVLNIVENLT